MKTRKVNRYYCDFCKKQGGSASHMRRHESACTMNPKRICRVCKMLDYPQVDLGELVKLLPNHETYFKDDDDMGGEARYYSSELTTASNNVLSKLRDATENCPACILAAIRQAHIPVPMVTDFNFTEEMEAAWAVFNESQREQTHYG